MTAPDGAQPRSGADSAAPDAAAGAPGALPKVGLPTGGGAIRGIGEKFAADAVTGTGSFTVPIPLTSGRAGFGPTMALAYDSGSGNGPFGLGWSIGLPALTRKTDKGLPRYDDAHESDVFVLSSAEDLVPVGSAHHRVGDHEVRRYRPRVEGLFARIERWTRHDDPADVHWRSITVDNVLTTYGADENSRIADPQDTRRVFTWLICETRDDRGNAVRYDYATEDNDRSTAQRYLKRIRYGNATPLLNADGSRPRSLSAAQLRDTHWLFEAVLDYGDHDTSEPLPQPDHPWATRDDPFSSYRSGFEVRTSRLCRRVLMFHHFPDEPDVGRDCLVDATELTYSPGTDPASVDRPVYSMLRSVTQARFRRTGAGYLRRTWPAVEFDYSEPVVQHQVRQVPHDQLAFLPRGVDGRTYRWADLHGEGIPGVLTEQGGAWWYLPNLSAANDHMVEFGSLAAIPQRPNRTLTGGAQLMDLAGDGRLDVVVLDGPDAGLYEHDEDDGWREFRPFTSRLTRNMSDPDLRLVDLDGDGLPDVLITEGDALVWHPGRGRAGFGPANRVAVPCDERNGPRVVFADSTQTVQLADMSGDGLSDLVRIRNGDVCYWPNLGYGRFGARITLRNVPRFDDDCQFSASRLRLADIDGSGTTDLIYLHRKGSVLYFNQSGNSLSAPHDLTGFPLVDDVVSVDVIDLLGNGTACLVWSSPLPDDTGQQMRYIDLMGTKPHLLVRTANNLGAETRVHYRPSTYFYLTDRQAGRPWITRSPAPVHVVDKVESIDHVNRHRFTTRYAYHHQYFDAAEREPRGFGMVEQWDTEEFAVLADLPDGVHTDAYPTNVDAATYVPPVHTKTWFHTGAYLGREHVSDYFAGLLGPHDRGEYYREPAWADDDAEARRHLLPDTVLPEGLTLVEEREACRALKGSMLRQEVYGLDGTEKAQHPYTVTEQNFTIQMLQPRGHNQHAVFLTHPRERFIYHYERHPTDPRVQHTLTLTVDDFGHVIDEVAIAYGRRVADPSLPADADRAVQARTLITAAHNTMTNPIDDGGEFRAPLPADLRAYEITGAVPVDGLRFAFNEGTGLSCCASTAGAATVAAGAGRRLINHTRWLYRPDDLGASAGHELALLPLGELQPRALGEVSYKLGFDTDLLDRTLRRGGKALLPEPGAVLREGGYTAGADLADLGLFPSDDPQDQWWLPTGRSFMSPYPVKDATEELDYARKHFFRSLRYRDPFQDGETSRDSEVVYDSYDLLMVDNRDPLGNRITVGERRRDGSIDPNGPGNDYRVLQPARVMDPNRNRTQVAFDVLGMVVGTAVMGKPEETQGDSLNGFAADLTEAIASDHLANPIADPNLILNRATTRTIYDLFAYQRSNDQLDPQPAAVYTLTRETHDADLQSGEQTRFRHTLTYSDGFGREIQQKIQAEPGPIGPGEQKVNRWVGSGWTIFNNKGKPVRKYEPFFTPTHRFEFGVTNGVSSTLLYDPAERVAAILHPNDTFEKVVFDPWKQVTWDVNDTVLADPRTDIDINGYALGHFVKSAPTWQTWFAQRQSGALGVHEQAAAHKAAAHADTPTTTHFDTLGRSFLTLADNGPDSAQTGSHVLFGTRIELDIEGHQLAVRDAIKVTQQFIRDAEGDDPLGRVIVRYAYDMLGNRIYQHSMDAGARWMLDDVAGKPLRAWDQRGHTFRTDYDPLRRPLRSYSIGADPVYPNRELLTERLFYGEEHPEAEPRNLRGVLHLYLDQAGAVTTEARDFKGNPLQVSRRLTAGTRYREVVDWKSVDAALPLVLAAELEADSYTSIITYDALNRPATMTTPHTSTMQPSVIRPGYNEANLLERLDVILRGATANGRPMWTQFISNIDYDARGQCRRIEFGNGTSTSYEYDPLTFRLVHLLTTRKTAGLPNDLQQPPLADWPRGQLQNLQYTYDPVGNISRIRDDAQQRIFFANRRIEPSSEYTYDAVYRLIEATGREHLGQDGRPIPHSADDALRSRLPHPGDGTAMGNYTERYVYDAVGNFLTMQHSSGNPAHPGWTRSYFYAETSLLENGTGEHLNTSNRLTSTAVKGEHQPLYERYRYDAHGNVTRAPHLGGADPDPNLHWNYQDQLQQTDRDGGGVAYYVYDAAGQRVRKVWEKSADLVEERIYLGGYEIYRQRHGAERLERETLHIMDDTRRVALVETRTLDTAGNDRAPAQQIRYQFGNHLGSASLELDHMARVISYEEYTPYGSTSYQGVRSQTETSKRYRYTGKERDEETGFNYHGARYYAPWLGRWTTCDPAGFKDGTNPYLYVRANPVSYTDPTGRQSDDPFPPDPSKAIAKSLSARLNDVKAVATGTIEGYKRLIVKTVVAAKDQAIEAATVSFGAAYIYKTGDPETIAKYEQSAFKNDEALLKYPLTTIQKAAAKLDRGAAAANSGDFKEAAASIVEGIGDAILLGLFLRTLVRRGATSETATKGAPPASSVAAEPLQAQSPISSISTREPISSISTREPISSISTPSNVVASKEVAPLPALDLKGKVHGTLPKAEQLGSYSAEELTQLQGELELSIQERIRKTVEIGPDEYGQHGQRQAAEQLLVRQIAKHLEGRSIRSF